jgi:hypothetical protein
VRRRGYDIQGGQRFKPAASPKPDLSFEDQLKLDVGGLDIQLRHAKGETDDHAWAWIPRHKAICAGDFFIWNFPNAGNPQKVQRFPVEWAAALREMGALMTGIIIAGRTGAAFAAELGSMKISEEIDAFSTLGVSPIDHLVLPRMLGLFVMMPLLVIYADFVGIAGGMLVAVTLLDLSPTQFVGGLLTAVTLSDGLLGIFKGTVFGLIIGLAGCMKGMQTGSDAGAVGRSATSAVVLGITLVIMANAVIDWLAALLQI